MQYREFGRSGAKVSILGFGAMRMPENESEAIRVIHRALDLGVNYVDTAPYYMEKTSEVTVGKALKGRRDKVYLSTKNPIEDASGENWRARLEKSLRQLDTDYIDFYHMWGISWKEFEEKINVPNGPLDAAAKAREAGLIRHLSFSFHDKPENLFKLIDTGLFETMLVQYNLLDRSNEEAIAYASEKGLGVAIMGPIGGGRLGGASEVIESLIPGGVKSSPEIALRFVLSNPHVDVALSGMGSIQMVEENVAVASRTDALSRDELRRIQESLEENQRLADLYCTGCNYCMPCPNDVNIPVNFRLMNYFRVYGLKDFARKSYALLGTPGYHRKGKKAEECLECGECEPKCPQKLPIIAQLKETARELGGASPAAVEWHPE